jgi:hypothetical protein
LRSPRKISFGAGPSSHHQSPSLRSKLSTERMLWMEEDSSVDAKAERRRRDESTHSRCSTFRDKIYRDFSRDNSSHHRSPLFRSKLSKETMLWTEEDSYMDAKAERRRRDESAHSRSTFSDKTYRDSSRERRNMRNIIHEDSFTFLALRAQRFEVIRDPIASSSERQRRLRSQRKRSFGAGSSSHHRSPLRSKLSKETMLWMEEDWEMMLWIEDDSSMLDENSERTKRVTFSPTTTTRRRDESAHSRCSTLSDRAYRDSCLFEKCARLGLVF